MREHVEESWTASVGNAVVAAIGRGILWCFKRIAKSPMNSVGLAVLGLGVVLGSANALWMQPGKHPSPLFMETAAIAEANDPTPQKTVQITPGQIKTPDVVSSLPSPAARNDVKPTVVTPKVPVIGNKDVAEMQNKLAALGMFSGKVDGYYGPATANAIRAFESANGLPPKGALTQEVLRSISSTTVPAKVKSATPSRVVMPAPALKRRAANTAKPQAVAVIPAVKMTPVSAPTQTAPKKLDPIEKIALTATPKVQTQPVVSRNSAPVADTELVKTVQTGLVRLGFLNTEITGKFDASTARAIREFENYNNYKRTGEMSPELIDMLGAANAFN